MCDLEFGKCDICGNDKFLSRKYFNYDNIKCECHSPNHFIFVSHCNMCEPVEPDTTKISCSLFGKNIEIKTTQLRKIDSILKQLNDEVERINI